MTLDIGLTSDVGRERDINQDSAGVTEVSPGVWLLVVADGMGGHVAGEQAARIVIESLFSRFQNHGADDHRDNLYYGILDAHKEALAYAVSHGTQGMGSTVVAAVLKGDKAWIAHVGDSRLYQFRDGRVVFATTDHTRVQMMLELGLLSPEQAKDHPEGNVITRAVGHDPTTRGTTFEADVRAEPISVRDGDTFLLCSDGLYDLVDDREMIENVAGRPAEEGTQRLVALANRRGGHDNITVLVAHRGSGTSAPPPPLGLPSDSYPGRDGDTVEEPAFTTLEDSMEAPALLDEGDEGDALAMVRTSEHTAVVLPVPPADRSLRWAVLALSTLVVLLVGLVIFLVLRPGPTSTTTDPVTVNLDDDDSARDPVDDDDSAGDDDSSGDDDSVGDDDSAGDDDSGGP